MTGPRVQADICLSVQAERTRCWAPETELALPRQATPAQPPPGRSVLATVTRQPKSRVKAQCISSKSFEGTSDV